MKRQRHTQTQTKLGKDGDDEGISATSDDSDVEDEETKTYRIPKTRR